MRKTLLKKLESMTLISLMAFGILVGIPAKTAKAGEGEKVSISIYDPSKATGLTDGAAELIADLSSADGEVYLYAWDSENNEPLRFEYRKGAYTVVYIDDGDDGIDDENGLSNQMMGHWDVSYSFNVLKYDAE